MRTLSIVIPALNEAQNIPHVIKSIPVEELLKRGWQTEIVVVDNASTDGTGQIARDHGATVIEESARGYGNAYQAGIAKSTGSLIATGDADCTYPFEDLPDLVDNFVADNLDFMNTDRLSNLRSESMTRSHVVGNFILTGVSKILFRSPFKDSQSGMWIFKRTFWDRASVSSPGMAFSQEIKIAALLGGFRCAEVPIDYRQRGGEKKLNSVPDGLRNLGQLFAYRFRFVRKRRAAQIATTRSAVDVPTQRAKRVPADDNVLRTGHPTRVTGGHVDGGVPGR